MSERAVDTVIIPPVRDLGDGFRVRRALPAPGRQMVGPFIFFDEMGPAVLAPGQGLDVRPHPHIGLATVTYLFAGEILHRDSLGSVQAIQPGAVNWMIAGRGIVHSERTPAERRATGDELRGLQVWVALPRAAEEMAPSFAHVPANALPTFEGDGVLGRVIAGTVHGATAARAVPAELFYADATLAPGAAVPVETHYEERAFYVVDGEVSVEPGDEVYAAGRLVVLRPGAAITLRAGHGPARVMLLGGEAMPEPRHIWWNFVSSSRERIEQAKTDWREGRFARVPGETEFIPLPGTPPRVDYP